MSLHRLNRTTGRIAVVDDDASVRKALSRLLETASYDVETFESARQFIATLSDRAPACAIIDLQMPDMTGIELQHYLTATGVAPPTIIITAYDEPGVRDQCIAAGASAYLVKPLLTAALISAIKEAIAKLPRSGVNH